MTNLRGGSERLGALGRQARTGTRGGPSITNGAIRNALRRGERGLPLSPKYNSRSLSVTPFYTAEDIEHSQEEET